MTNDTTVQIPGYPQYSVTRDGSVLSTKRGKTRILIPSTRNGYLMVNLSTDGIRLARSVHSLVALAFLGPLPPNKTQINHIDGNKFNNRIENLEYCTRSENMKHAFAVGLCSHKGSNHPRAKLSEGDIPVIKLLLSSGNTIKFISAVFNVSRHVISNIKRGKSWSHIP